MPKKSESALYIDRKTLELFWDASLKYKKLLIGSLLFPISVICTGTLVPLYVGRILATLGRSGGDPAHYVPYFAVAAVIGVTCNRIGSNLSLSMQANVMRDLQTKTLDTLLGRSTGFHNNNVGGKLVSDAIDFSNYYGSLANVVYSSILPLVITLISGSIIIFWESWPLGLLVVSMAVFTVGSGFIESRRRSKLRRLRLLISKAVTAHLADTILNVLTVKTFAREESELEHSDELSSQLKDMRLRDWQLSSRRANDRIAILLILQAAFVLVVIRLVHRDPSLLGIGIFAFSYTITLGNRLFDVNTMIRTVEDSLLQSSPMTEIMLETPEIRDKPDASVLKVSKGRIDLNHVTFHYHDNPNQDNVFKELQLNIAPGEKVGLVGPSGGGKSTLTRLLLRFEDIDGGEMVIDGQNIAEVTQMSLRQSIAYVPQEPLLFHRPVSENIGYGVNKPTMRRIKLAAQAAHADEFIKQLPLGYETIVGERGVKLSGGQRQRIAIARAILKAAPILVLDEATSALDSESEAYIQDALWRLMKGRTAIVVAHRLSTIQHMDRIIVLDNGTITEEGTHQALLKQKGLYAKLWKRQSGGFIDE